MIRCVVWVATAAALVACARGAATGPAESPASSAPAASGPDAKSLSAASADDADWLVWGKTFGGNRFTGLTRITKGNVAQLHRAWETPVNDDGEEEASPIVYHDRLYVSTAHGEVLSLDAATGKLRWAAPYNPSYELQYAVNRGVGIADGKVYVATEDCRIVALDALTGKTAFNVPGCTDTSNTWYSTAAYVYKEKVVVGTSGGDLGSMGSVRAFDARDGKLVWNFNTVPQPGEPNHDTWPGDSWKHGGAAVWSGLALDPRSDTLYVTPGNAGPNLTLAGRKGRDLYSESVVAIDVSGSTPHVRWYYQILQNDTHDADPAMPPVLFDAKVRGVSRALLATADKAGDFIVLDRTTGAGRLPDGC